MLDKITQAVLDLKGGTEIPKAFSYCAFINPKDEHQTLCTIKDNDNSQYVWAANDSSNARNENRRICTLDEYLVHAAKVKEEFNLNLKTWNAWNELHGGKLETPKKKYWDGVSVPQIGDTVKQFGVECVVEHITSIGIFVLVDQESRFHSLASLGMLSPVKTKKDLVVDSIWEKLTNTGVSSDTDKNIIKKLYDLNLLKEID